MSTWYSVDFETAGPNKYACVLDRCVILPFDIDTGKIEKPITYNFRLGKDTGDGYGLKMKPGANVVMHNADFDYYLTQHVTPWMLPKNIIVHDTYLMAKHWRNDLPGYSLKALSWYFFGELYPEMIELNRWLKEHGGYADDIESEFDMTRPPGWLVQKYCEKDVKMTARIAHFLWPEVKDNFAFNQDEQFIPINIEMERRGIYVDKPGLKHYRKNLGRCVRRNMKNASTLMGLDDTGKKPTGDALRERLEALGETRRTKKSRKIMANEVVLRDHKKDRAIRLVGKIKSAQKEAKTYAGNILDACGDRSCFHPNLVQSAAITRRYRSYNLYGTDGQICRGQVQNVPRGEGIRTFIVPPPAHGFVKLDLASIEARLGAHAMSVFCGNTYFTEQYKSSDSFNMYLFVVRECTGHGDVTKKDPLYAAYKQACLGIQYGAGVDTTYTTLHDKFDLPYIKDDVHRIYGSINKKFPMFRMLQRKIAKLVERQGYIHDDFGAIYYVPKNEIYKAVNYYCQGCAGNILKWWILRVYAILHPKDFGNNLVHDEIDMCIWLGEGKRKAEARVQAYCDTLKKLDLFTLPIRAEASAICKNWGEAG